MISSSETIGEILTLNAEQSRCRQHDEFTRFDGSKIG